MQKRLRPLNWIAIAVILGGFLAATLPPGGAVPVVEARPLYSHILADSASVTGSGCSAYQVAYIITDDGIKGGASTGSGGGTCRVTVHWDAPPASASDIQLYGFDVGHGPTCELHRVSWENGDELIQTAQCDAIGGGHSFSGLHVTDVYFEWSGADTHVYMDLIYIEGSPGVTATPTSTATPTATSVPPTATFVPGVACDDLGSANYICNGSFEYPYSSNPHDWIYDGGTIFDENANPSAGLAYCSSHYANITGAGISQKVYLPAGPLYMHFHIRRAHYDSSRRVYMQVEITSATSQDIGLNWIVRDGKNGFTEAIVGGTGEWTLEEETHTFLTPNSGWYDVKFSNVLPFGGLDENGVYQDWTYNSSDQDAYQLDDVTLSSLGYRSYCGVQGGATATPLFSPTPRGGTPTRTPTPGGPTQTPAPVSSFNNCNFEQGMQGWTPSGTVNIILAGGPIGPQFARVQGYTSNIAQSFYWAGGPAYFTFWVGPGSGGSVHVTQTGGSGQAYDVALWAHSESSPAWKLVKETIAMLQPGTYKIVVWGNAFAPMEVDGILPAYNTYQYCGGTGGATPTAGPTSFVTPTPSRTPTSGPTRTPTATRTPGPTSTPNFTWTPSQTPSATSTPNGYGPTATALAGSATALAGTATALAATATAQASITPPSSTPTNTPTATDTPANDATATALASITPGTSTPAATATATEHPTNTPPPATGTSTPGPTAIPNPNPQPEPAPGADCQRPDNPFNLAGWMEFEVCQVLKWTLWNDENTTQALNIQATLQVYEPLGTLNELTAARDTLRDEIEQYDWANTGLQTGELPDLSIIMPNNTPSGILTGHFDAAPDPGGDFAFVRTCGLQIADVFGDAMGQGLCAAINWMLVTGILNWVQYLFDLAIWIAFARYVWHVVTTVIPTML